MINCVLAVENGLVQHYSSVGRLLRRFRGLTARPHFAQVMLEKRYVSTLQQAFDDYLDESAKGHVHRQEPQFAEGVERIRNAGGIASLAHPVRVIGDLQALMPELCDAGLNTIEAYHSDHTPQHVALYLELAERYGLLVTGGTDFHGSVKPGLMLGTGRNGNLKIPPDLIDKLQNGAIFRRRKTLTCNLSGSEVSAAIGRASP